jgi:tetratricopeptide (TPR) repeat protein
MFARAEAVARDEAIARGDAFSWFNLGSSLAAQGDPEASTAFDQARALTLPWRMMWYQHGAFEAYAAAGRWADVRALAAANLANAPNLEESHYWLGRAAEAAGDAPAARASFEEARRLNPNYALATNALTRVSAGSP